MHARKQPRANDGYTERKDAHLQQWLDRHQAVPQSQQRGNGGKYADQSPAEGSHSRHSRTDSPGSQSSPRYHNKMAYLERHKDKRGSLHLAEEKVSQYLATGSIGERAPQTYGDYDEGDRQSENSQDGRHSAHDKDQSSSSGSRKAEIKDDRDHRAEVQKSAVRVCGDWSEHISSSGKRYYYNCQTEVSQWEKPKEWTQSSRRPERRDSRGNDKSCSSVSVMLGGGGERARHSSISDHPDGRNPSSSSTSHPLDSPYTSASSSAVSQRPSDKYFADVSSSRGGHAHPQDLGVSRRNSTAEGGYSHNHKGPVAQTSHSGHCSNLELKRNSVHLDSSCGDESARQRQRLDNEGGQRSSQRREAIETLQELQKALSLHIRKQQSKGTSQSASSSTGTTSAQLQSQLTSLEQNLMGHTDSHHHHTSHPADTSHPSPHNSALLSNLPTGTGEEGRLMDTDDHHLSNNNIEDDDGRDSPDSIMSTGTSCHSPTPSLESPPTMPAIGTSALSVAALKSQQSMGLSPALSNYYNEKLIGHVLGWQGEQLEKQAERFRQEALQVGSLHFSHVCVELKRARSNVRTAEIQSTIQEQRLLMLQQQRMEIENLKPPTSLLPS